MKETIALTAVADINWCKIESSGLLQFDGPDTQAFLQGQLTSDAAALTASNSQYSGYCTPKGRLLACLLLWQNNGAYRMMLPHELAERIRKRLSMYILRAKVKASDISDEHVLFGVAGAGAAAAIATCAGAVPGTTHEVTQSGDVSVLKLPVERYLLVAHTSAASTLESALLKHEAASPETLWSQWDIAAGIPSVVAATQEQFVPQTVNFDAIGAVSFDKGCYPGQEIVARAHYLGKVKQRMVRARIEATEPPCAGDKLYSMAFGDQASGMIVNAASKDAGTHDVLAVVQTADSTNSANVHHLSPDGPLLHVLPLPYVVK